jgi:uncharacterized repeat protein (TIGR01451 family)
MTKRTIYGFLLLLVGSGFLICFAAIGPHPAAKANTSTPTPTTPPPSPADSLLCRLTPDQDCAFINPLDAAVMLATASQQTYPRLGAQGVPTYTWLSAAFEQQIEPTSLTPDTFLVIQPNNQPVAGAVSYIEAEQTAIFKPDVPLWPSTTYTATVSGNIRDTSGQALQVSRVWTFTTASLIASLYPQIQASALAAQGMNIYFGDLHNHTSYSDGVGAPAQAYAVARANGLDFMAVSEHCFMMNATEWEDVKNQAKAATVDGQFVGLPSFEYSNFYGHLNVFDTETYVSKDDPNYDTLPEFYNWLVNHPTAFAQFNHPIKRPGLDQNFNNFAFYPQAELKIVLQDLETPDQFFLSLNTGWHLGSLRNLDTHSANWGCCPLMGLIAPSLTRNSILEALRARRTFFVSPSDRNLALVLQANGYWMGSAIPNTGSINFTITAYDPDPNGKPLRLELYDNGTRVASVSLSSRTTYTWQPTVKATLGHYYYAEAYQAGWYYPAYSSPIWVERPPTAEAGPNRVVAPGAPVTLDGRASFDPDGDALAYSWTQEGGTGVGLANSNTAQPSFMAPASLGNLTFRLNVTDPGFFRASDTTTITVTDAPILASSKSGPGKVEPGQPFDYVLTVVNNGVTPANQVNVTDVLPPGTTYISGGTLQPGNIVSWVIPNLAANGGTAQVSVTVTIDRPTTNKDYGATCAGCVAAQGSTPVYTHFGKFYLPLINK